MTRMHSTMKLCLTVHVLACLLLSSLLLPEGVAGFSNLPSSRRQHFLLLHSEVQKSDFSPSWTSLSLKTRSAAALLQSSRVLSEQCETDFFSVESWIRNWQARFVEYRHVRKQHRIHRAAATVPSSFTKTGLLHLSKQYLHAPNKMLLQGYVLAHQQAQYDHLHAHHESSLDTTTLSLSALQKFQQHRKAEKEARLAAKYAAMELLEDRAFQICKDLGMI